MGAALAEAPELEPSPEAMRSHLDWLTEGARGAYDDALVEIAHEGWRNGGAIANARLFGLDELDEAVTFAAETNRKGLNVYVGAALRLPDAPRDKRARTEHFYVATAVPIDIDEDYDATRSRAAAVVEDGLVVTTGLTPARRSQHWVRLDQPCDDDLEFQQAFEALVHCTGADQKVKDAARVMRLGGTVAYPSPRKIAKGYSTELTTVTINPHAAPSAAEALQRLAPAAVLSVRTAAPSERPSGNQGIVRGGGNYGQLVTDGRETFFRDLLLEEIRKFQESNGADPTSQELWETAFARFQAEADNADGRWTDDNGQRELVARVNRTLGRLRAGRLAVAGLYSIDTEAGRSEAESAKDARQRSWLQRIASAAEPASTTLSGGGLVQKLARQQEAAGAADRDLDRAGDADPLARPFQWRDPSTIPARQFLYGHHLIRQFMSCTFAPGGVGKSALGLVEAAAMASGKPLLGVRPSERLKVWVWSGEDPAEETGRRLAAICLHFGLERADLEGWLFLGSGREADIIIAEQTRDGARISVPSVERVVRVMRARAIDVAVIDPFVSSHRVTENDNNAIDVVAKAWATIAGATNAAVDLVHHTRKTTGAEMTVEDGRGATALLNAARSARVLNPMSEAEAAKAGVSRRRSYFRVDNGKANLAPPPDGSAWFRFASVQLQNGGLEGGDNVGVVERWQWPDALTDVTVDHLLEVQRRVSTGSFRASDQANDWVGHVVADVLEVDLSDPVAKAKVKGAFATWTKNGLFGTEMRAGPKRDLRPYVKVLKWAEQ
ncbi:MAG TPA: AAA family ATPase [Caulobacteraceae bacterium]|jgi:hypothetical protein|nr:AAA family ATPase [Caulobacteraceae bacterium]